MAAVTTNLALDPIFKGKAADYTLTLSSTGGGLALADIEDIVATFKADPSDADSAAIVQKSLGAGITLTGVSGDNVLALLALTCADTALFTAGVTYSFDIQVDTTARCAETALQGTVRIKQPITISN